jgi:microcystin-dependent protein
MPVTISGTTGIGTPAVNATGNIQAASVNASGNIQAVGNVVGTGVCPAGVVLPFAISTAPTGWLVCDGTIIPASGSLQGVDAALLQTLRGLLGTTYGSTGQLPNLQGQFIRGLTTNLSTTSRDPLSGSRVLGSVQEDAFERHTHTYGDVRNSFNSVFNTTGGTGMDGAVNTSRTTNSTGDTETRPVNIALLYCIKY